MRKHRTAYFNVSNGERQGGMLSPKLFAIYVEDLSQDLVTSRSGCCSEDHCINHVMDADHICLLAPSAIGLQRMFDVCFDFSIKNHIKFNLIKSVCIVYKPKNNKLYYHSVRLDCNILEYISCSKYLGFTFNMNGQNDDDMLRQMRTLLAPINYYALFITVLLTLN